MKPTTSPEEHVTVSTWNAYSDTPNRWRTHVNEGKGLKLRLVILMYTGEDGEQLVFRNYYAKVD